MGSGPPGRLASIGTWILGLLVLGSCGSVGVFNRPVFFFKNYLRGKRKKKDVQEFQYNHGGYKAFKINDPKPRNIHKASVKDRLLHHAIYRILYPFFDRTFISDSFSCRNDKGTHKALNRFCSFGCKVSRNHKLRVRCYIRYADDFVILSDDKNWLENQIEPIKKFLSERLKLKIHPDKIFIKTLASGVDFLGWINFHYYRVLRTTTKRRMLRQLRKSQTMETLNSYLGLMKWGNTYKLRNRVLEDKII